MTSWRDRLQAIRNRISGTGTAKEPASKLPQGGETIYGAAGGGDEALFRPNAENNPRPSLVTEEPTAETYEDLTRIKDGDPPKIAPKPRSAPKVKRKPDTKAPAVRRSVSRSPVLRPVALNLGIDFGTSFTKVCYRDVGTEESGVAAVGHGFKKALVPSVVAISGTGRLYLADNTRVPKSAVLVPYLKMRLAGAPIGDTLPSVAGFDLNHPECTRALAAWFLASVVARSQEWIALHEADRLTNRKPVWSANVGVPVEHFDSLILKTFKEVLGVAWVWVKDGDLPASLKDATVRYGLAVNRLNEEVTDFHAVPEIAAAVQSFVMSREALPGIYVYFDIGGGTVDGVAFNYINRDGDRKIHFYSGKVESLGISAIAARIGEEASVVDVSKLDTSLRNCPQTTQDDLVLKIRRMVGEVVITAKQKDGRNWQDDAIQSSDYQRKFIGQLSTKRMRPLVVFIGGGGSKSNWYSSAIASTYTAFQHHNAGIPPYKLLEVQRPKDFSMPEVGNDDFTRFAISYGLSIPYGEGPEIGLPSQFAVAEKPREWRPPGLVDYADSKDVYG